MQPIIENREIRIHTVEPKMTYDVRSYKNHVLRAIECYPDSPVYEEVNDLFDELYPEALKLIETQMVWVVEANDGSGSIPELQQCDEIIYATITLGEGIITAINEYFEKDEMIEGMLLDAIATGILFKLGEELYGELYKYIKGEHKGVIALSPGERGTPITYQKIIEAKMDGSNGIRVTDGYLLEPIKSISTIYGIGNGLELPKRLHNCKKCKDATCKWRLAPYEG